MRKRDGDHEMFDRKMIFAFALEVFAGLVAPAFRAVPVAAGNPGGLNVAAFWAIPVVAAPDQWCPAGDDVEKRFALNG